MPTYEYECQKCGRKFEKFQSISEPPITRCIRPRCKGKVKRLLGTGAGLIFKGSGFYTTDYRSSQYKAASKKESEGNKSASSKAETKPSAPANKSESKK